MARWTEEHWDAIIESQYKVVDPNSLEEYKPTNADRIRSMNDEELAEFINTVSNDSIDTITACGTKSHTEVWEDKESTMQWLQSEAE